VQSSIFLLGVVVFFVLFGASGCAPEGAVKPAVQPTPLRAGTILSVRAVERRSAETPLRAVLLEGSGGPDSRQRPLAEFIVRADDGATLSIVQPDEPGFRAGDRVIIRQDGYTRLARPG
jgi:outer membrane lipoprotein SlyB